MADLEKHAIKRDGRFLIRLVLALSIAALGGALIFMKMTSPELAGCAAETFGGAPASGTGASQ